jgi:hypothetical protein
LREITLSANTHGVLEISVEILFDQMSDHLGVGLGNEAVAFFDQLALQSQVILDDAVMHHHDVAVAIAMRMGILFGRPSVCRPTRMADAIGPFYRIQTQSLFEVTQLALCPPHPQAVALFEHCDSGRIVSPVFQALQPVEDYGYRFLPSDVANYSAHVMSLNQSRISTR